MQYFAKWFAPVHAMPHVTLKLYYYLFCINHKCVETEINSKITLPATVNFIQKTKSFSNSYFCVNLINAETKKEHACMYNGMTILFERMRTQVVIRSVNVVNF